jgi:multicomponent Na+:H+ antiporter subunit E
MSRDRVAHGLVRGVALAGLWWALSGGDAASWVVGAPAVAIAAVAADRMSPRGHWRVSPSGAALFVPFFLWRTLLGSVDVAWRALHPALPIAPALIAYPLRLPAGGPSRVFFAQVVNLLPGTLSAELGERDMTVHLLAGDSPDAVDGLRRLESRTAALFAIPIAPRTHPPRGRA